MHPRLHHPASQASLRGRVACIALLTLAALSTTAPRALAQFSSGSNGSDGVYAPTASGNFTPSQFHGTGVANNVFNFTTITIPAGVTIKLIGWVDNAPVYWLAQGNVDIEGTLDVSGAPGPGPTTDPGTRVPAVPGSGGYAGGVGGFPGDGQNATPGSGPGGGVAGTGGTFCNAGGGTFTGNDYLIPLVGGSGGAGNLFQNGEFGPGGGAGGDAILIASSTQIIVNGTINANGGGLLVAVGDCDASGGGSGGAIRLVSNTITGNIGGMITAVGGASNTDQPGSAGRLRLEAYTFGFSGSFNGTPETQGPPINQFNSFIPTTPPPSIQVTSINNTPISENPYGFPDITINTDQPVPVVVTGHNVPLGTVPTLTILGDTVDQPPFPCPNGLQGTLATSTCITNVKFPFGGARGLVVTTWQNPGSTALQKK